MKVEILSDDEEEEEVLTLTDENKPTALEKMIALIALLVEKSRGTDKQLHLSQKDYMAIVGGGKVRHTVSRGWWGSLTPCCPITTRLSWVGAR